MMPPPAYFKPNTPYGISFDTVIPLMPSGKLPTDTTITFYFRVKNTGDLRLAITNSFRIYSTNGATWGMPTGDTINFGWGSWDEMFDMTGFNIDYRSCGGIDDDTIVFWGVAMFNGMSGYFDERSYAITIGPLDESMDGKTICIDSASFPPAGAWIWVDEYSHTSVPPWGGPYCFQIEKANTISISGYLNYLDPVPPDTNQMPMRRIIIEMMDYDQWPQPDQLLALDSTDDLGHFSMGPVENSDVSGDLDVYFNIYSKNRAAYVTCGYNDDIYTIQTPILNNLPSGQYDTSITATLQDSKPFFVADVLLDAKETWDSLVYYGVDSIQVVLDDEDTGTWFNFDDDYIHIRNREPNSDTYDRDVIFHEYAHWIEDIFLFFDQGAGEHQWYEINFPSIAATEGFAHFLSCVFRANPYLNNCYNNFVDTFWVNAENGCWGYSGSFDTTIGSANNYGDSCEAAVCGILWDIYDNVNDDYSTYQWPPLAAPNDSNPDGIRDTLSNGPDNILEVLLHRTIDGDYPDNINEFWQAWFQSPSKGHAQAMRDIWYEHGCIVCGDANGDGLVNAGDPVFIISYIWKHGPAPNPLDAGDANGDSSVNVGDAVYLVNYVFKGGSAPVCN